MHELCLTDYHSQYYAYELTKKRSSSSEERFAGTLVDAQVDLNPHQIDAALFAFKSPLSKGALLADEVGLGKTIEAGLLVSQKWAERKRSILIITPSNLRKQWFQELTDKFFIPCSILESKSYNQAVRNGAIQPFRRDSLIICSYQFARNKANDIRSIPWDLVVIDEAHRLRNVYKPTSMIANALKAALSGAPKLLLTATPLQNSILELYGLVSIIDDHVFGDIKTFRERYARLEEEDAFSDLRARLQPVCHRTLRRQVEPYVRYTKRYALLQEFTPEENEDQLYNLVSEYLRRENLHALPASQRSLMTLVLRKLMASSSFAIAGALDTIIDRLGKRLKKQSSSETLMEGIAKDVDGLEEDIEEMNGAEHISEEFDSELEVIRKEVDDLIELKRLASSINCNAKGQALLAALQRAFSEADRLGSPRKAIIFTESRKTQDYLLRVLAESRYNQGIVLFNGSNTDQVSKEVYKSWLERNKGTDKVTGSKTADMRTALVEYFRDEGSVMIATEAGAEGINLQFCSLVVNYDLPWNPQRVEQRIGRCHRYGQKHDVVVVNFLNKRNAADQRVYQLLNEKFHLFEGIFGASDEVLGVIESGVDLERRIADIYQNCRKQEEINIAFDKLQLELMDLINEKVSQTRKKLIENFDDEVRQKLRIRDDKTRSMLTDYEKMLMSLTRHELRDCTEFADENSFNLKNNPFDNEEIHLGRYELPRRSGDAHIYRLTHPLALEVINRAIQRNLPSARLDFLYDHSKGRFTYLEQFIGRWGLMTLNLFNIESFEQSEDYLVFSAACSDGTAIVSEEISKLFRLEASEAKEDWPADVLDLPDEDIKRVLERETTDQIERIQKDISRRNAEFFDAEAMKIETWSEDLKNGLEYEIKDLDRQMREVRKQSRMADSMEEKLKAQQELKSLESSRNSKRRNLFDEQDKIDVQRESLIRSMESLLKQSSSQRNIFTVYWRLV